MDALIPSKVVGAQGIEAVARERLTLQIENGDAVLLHQGDGMVQRIGGDLAVDEFEPGALRFQHPLLRAGWGLADADRPGVGFANGLIDRLLERCELQSAFEEDVVRRVEQRIVRLGELLIPEPELR